MARALFPILLAGLFATASPCRAEDSSYVKLPEGAPAAGPKLTAMVIVKDLADVAKEGLIDMRGININGVPLLDKPDFRKMMQKHLGEALTKPSLTKILDEIVVYYRAQGRLFVDVSAPPQEVTSGILQILVVEGKVGDVRVLGNKWSNAESMSKQVRSKPGEPLDADAIAQDLEWLNRNPFRQVDLVYVKGTEFGQANLLLRTVDKFPLRFYAGFDDSGTKLTQNERLSMGGSWGNIFRSDAQIDYQFLTSPDFQAFRAHSGSLTLPLPWRHVLTVFGSYSDIRAILPEPLNLGGYSWQTSLRYEVPLPGSAKFRHSLNLGFDYKQANNNLTFGGISVFVTATDVAQASLGYNARLKDSLGETSFRGTVFMSPGKMTAQNNDAAFQAARADAKARYVYGKLEVTRTTRLPFEFMLVNLLTVQAADANLLSSEQIGFGGYDTIRGYDTRILNTDSGYIVSTEVRGPSRRALAAIPLLQRLDDKWQGLAFLDFGAGSNHLRLSGEKPEPKLLSVGPGLRYTISTHVSLRVDYGWQLLNEVPGRLYASRSHAGLVVRY